MVGVLGKEEVGREKCVWEGEGKGREEMGRAKRGRERSQTLEKLERRVW